MCEIMRIKKGLTISTGWNLGKINPPIHLFAPLISIPKKGTKNNNIRDVKNRYGKYFLITSLFWSEIKKIIVNKNQMFKKKKIAFFV